MSNSSPDKKHVLVISSDVQILAEIKMELLPFFDVSISAASSSVNNVLEAYTIAAVVIYIGSNSVAAFSDFNEIFEVVKEKLIPILFVAERGNDDDETKAFEIGAVDYSARRRGTVEALVRRILLRINASEHEKMLLTGESSAPPSDTEAAEKSLRGKTFLIVDDVSLNRQMIKAMLSSIEDLVVEEASDGKEAIDKFLEKPERFSLILMDIQMPVMDGLEATRVLRAMDLEYAKKVPVIALTAATLESEIKECIAAGMNDFIAKPMTYDDLIAIAAEHII